MTNHCRPWFLLWVGGLLLTLSADEVRVFYRVASPASTVITDFTHRGILTWSNSAHQGAYLVEKATELTNTAWTPLTRGDFSQPVWSAKVHDFSPPGGMCFIPGGKFAMGDVLKDHSNATPVHTVYVSPFYMKQYEVNNEEVRKVLQWAYDRRLISITAHGVPIDDGSTNLLFALNRYNSDISFAEGRFAVKAGRTNFPCVYVSWFGAVAYCNFLSAMEGREQCYDLTNWTCDFSRNGYRLPTEAEWEFAARGGYEGTRFPWSDTNVITHSRANYRSDSNFSYDVSPTRGFHPDYVDLRPRTSPIGTFAPNNYGLYDMCGNVWDWCWDWAARYPSETQHDPTGPLTGRFRIFRGGSWFTVTGSVTCASRYTAIMPGFFFDDVGFRTALNHKN